MEEVAGAQKEVPQAENEERLKAPAQFPGQTQRWAAGIALGLLGLLAWSYKKHGHDLFGRAPPFQGFKHHHTVPHVHDGAGPESLEDALSSLEDSGTWASHGSHLPKNDLALPKKAKAKAAKKEKDDAEDAEAAAALDNLLGLGKGKKKSKKSKQSQADILRDTFKKMQDGEESGDLDSLFGGDLKDRLQDLVKDEEERDKDPEVRKAKSVIKDAIKKMEERKGEASAEDALLEEGQEGGHAEFAERLKEEASRKQEHDLATVREEFKTLFGSDSRRMLCSGCKLVAARLDNELNAHDVHESDNPATMLANKRKAIDSTCHSLRHLHITEGGAGPRFQVTESEDEGEGAAAPRLGQKLCTAVLEDAKFEVLSQLIRSKVPAGSFFHQPEHTSLNWERMLCAQRARVCKRSEVRDDDEAEEL